MRGTSSRVQSYAQLQDILHDLEQARGDFWVTRRHIQEWQVHPGNLEALSPASTKQYVRLLRALELMHEYCQREKIALHVEAAEMRGAALTYVAAARFGGLAHEALPGFDGDSQRVDFLCQLRDELIAALHADLTQSRPSSQTETALRALDPNFLPPDEPAEWQRWYDQLSHQVAREDELVNQRLLWMMQCEGFLFTAFGITLGARIEPSPHPIKVAMLTLIPVVGISGAFAVQRGVRSAHRVLDSLKRTYLASLERYKASHVRPFGRFSEHRHLVSSVFPWIMMGAWLLALVGLWVFGLRRVSS